MNDRKKNQATDAILTAKPVAGFRVQTGLRAAGEKVKYLEVKLENVMISSYAT